MSHPLQPTSDFVTVGGEFPIVVKTSAETRKILHLINGEHYSGAERVQDLLAARLPEFGYDVGFACLKPDKFPAARSTKETPLFETPMRSKLDLGIIGRLAEIVGLNDYAAIHAHTPRTVMLGALLKRRVRLPLFYHVHSPTSRDSTRALHNWANDQIEFRSIRRADKLLTVSNSLASYLKSRGVPEHRIAVVPNGVPFCQNRRSAQPPKQTWTIGTVALFRPRKGMEVLIQAVADLRRDGEDVRIRAVGPFESEAYERQLKAMVAELKIEDAIEWTGFTRDVNAELLKMDLFALPSMFGEGLPMVVLEAMAAGLPVVGTKVEGIPEAVRDGFDGRLAEPNDPSDFAKAIRSVMHELDWKALQANAIQRHADRFSDRAMAEGVAKVYRSCLE